MGHKSKNRGRVQSAPVRTVYPAVQVAGFERRPDPLLAALLARALADSEGLRGDALVRRLAIAMTDAGYVRSASQRAMHIV